MVQGREQGRVGFSCCLCKWVAMSIPSAPHPHAHVATHLQRWCGWCSCTGQSEFMLCGQQAPCWCWWQIDGQLQQGFAGASLKTTGIFWGSGPGDSPVMLLCAVCQASSSFSHPLLHNRVHSRRLAGAHDLQLGHFTALHTHLLTWAAAPSQGLLPENAGPRMVCEGKCTTSATMADAEARPAHRTLPAASTAEPATCCALRVLPAVTAVLRH